MAAIPLSQWDFIIAHSCIVMLLIVVQYLCVVSTLSSVYSNRFHCITIACSCVHVVILLLLLLQKLQLLLVMLRSSSMLYCVVKCCVRWAVLFNKSACNMNCLQVFDFVLNVMLYSQVYTFPDNSKLTMAELVDKTKTSIIKTKTCHIKGNCVQCTVKHTSVHMCCSSVLLHIP